MKTRPKWVSEQLVQGRGAYCSPRLPPSRRSCCPAAPCSGRGDTGSDTAAAAGPPGGGGQHGKDHESTGGAAGAAGSGARRAVEPSAHSSSKGSCLPCTRLPCPPEPPPLAAGPTARAPPPRPGCQRLPEAPACGHRPPCPRPPPPLSAAPTATGHPPAPIGLDPGRAAAFPRPGWGDRGDAATEGRGARGHSARQLPWVPDADQGADPGAPASQAQGRAPWGQGKPGHPP